MSIYKNFRRPGIRWGASDVNSTAFNVKGTGSNQLMSRFDQPTYLSFKLEFAGFEIDGDKWYNGAAQEFSGGVNYDRMPHPLFMSKGNDSLENRNRYSAIDFLLDNNEFTRAQLLQEFIQKFHSLQKDFQWYFQKIDGLEDLLKVDPKRGRRVPENARLTITTLEGLDLRMSYLLNLYRKIVWDDTYQRWILPDMMRYFTLKIYVSEFRTFHTPDPYDGMGVAVSGRTEEKDKLRLRILDNILPTWIINCEMCEFDLEGISYEYINELNINEEPEETKLSFKVKIGKIYEEQVYPIFYANGYLLDRELNGFNRSVEKDPVTGENFNSAKEDNNVSSRNSPYLLKRSALRKAQSLDNQDEIHESTASFNEMTNSKSLFGAKAAGSDGQLFTGDDSYAKVDPTEPNTWVGNAIDFGTAFAINLGKKFIDKARVTPIPGLGVSFNEAQSALESKNIITAIGTIRKGIATVAKDYVEPSELLEGNIVDNILISYLQGVIVSKATDPTTQLLQEAANTVLNDEGIWERIKDFSLATDLVSKESGEKNIPNPLEGQYNLKDAVSQSTQGDLSAATNLVGPKESNIEKKIEIIRIIEGAPTSQATTNKIIGA